MQKFIILALTLFVFLQFGCSKSIRYTEDEIQGFSPAIQDNIRKGEVDLGMTTQQVRYAWGAPSSIKFLEPFEGKTREEWVYTTLGVFGTRLLVFIDNKLIFVSD